MQSHDIDVVNVTKVLLSYSDDRVEDWMTPLKIQKLLYYTQAVSLVLTWKTLFKDEIQAWAHGPVIPSIFRRYKEFGSWVITIDINEDIKLNSEERNIIDQTWDMYSWYTAKGLEKLTHDEKPWMEARGDLQPLASSSNVISLNTMINYYSSN
jgi:uncharacterized phage-associated protein